MRCLKSYYACLLLALRLIRTVGLKVLLVGEWLGWHGDRGATLKRNHKAAMTKALVG